MTIFSTRRLALVLIAMLATACTGGSLGTAPTDSRAVSSTTLTPSSVSVTPTSTQAATSSTSATETVSPQTAGTPFGTFISLDNVDETFTRFSAGRFLFGSPEEAIEYLELARATDTQLIFSLVQRRNMRNDDGTFSLEAWKAGVDRFEGVDLAPYVEDGTILGHYMIDEPKSDGSWGGEVVTNAVIDEMARYSKQFWPTVPTVVRNSPERLRAHALALDDDGGEPVVWRYLDVAWSQYNAALHGDVEDYITTQTQSANLQGLGLINGLQVLAGGDGSSGIRPSPPFEPQHWIMSYDEMMTYGTHILERGRGCAFITFRWSRNEETYFRGTEQDRAHTDLQDLASTIDPAACPSK